MKALCTAVLFSLFSISASAQDVSVEGEISFDIGGTKIIIGSPTYKGNNHDARHRHLERRVRNLEGAVRFLMAQQGYHPSKKTVWECKLTTPGPFSDIYVAEGKTEAQGILAVIKVCKEEEITGFDCVEENVTCKEIEKK